MRLVYYELKQIKTKIKASQNNNNYYKQIARNWYWTRHVQLGNADFSFELLPRVNAYSRSTDLVMFPCRLRLLVCPDWFNQSLIYTYLWRGTFLMSYLSSIWRFYNTLQLVHIWRGGINSYKIDSSETAGSFFLNPGEENSTRGETSILSPLYVSRFFVRCECYAVNDTSLVTLKRNPRVLGGFERGKISCFVMFRQNWLLHPVGI